MKTIISVCALTLLFASATAFACDDYVCTGGSNDYINSEVYQEGASYARGDDTEAFTAGQYLINKGYGDAGRVRQEGGWRSNSFGPGESAADGASFNNFRHVMERRWEKFQGSPED